MRRLFPDSARGRQAALLRRLPGRWAATALVVAAVALLAPGGSVASASQPGSRPAGAPVVHLVRQHAMTGRAAVTSSRPAGPG